ncbi:HoxN/HupN/NixA family nickel/cobalt transporter [Paraburkholderia sp. BR10937]|uniref:HoxN/HupN/NixA family nickel/cobalt transporter n=1 Tax=Paraburkholderia sp. BR10937 TaxID=3236994 RepID=UPI0034D3150D
MPKKFQQLLPLQQTTIETPPLLRGRGRALLPIFAFIALLHALGWGTLTLFVAPLHLSVGSKAFGIGVGLTAYTLGMRHAFDADHIAAIDNTTRKLVGEGKAAGAVGFWFSLGHSTIVFGLTLLVALGVHTIASRIGRADSPFHALTGIIGTGISGIFLFLIAGFNLVTLVDVLKAFKRLRRGQYDNASLETLLDGRGFINRLLAPFMKIIRKPTQMFVVGLLFGLGFDTATEIALLVLTGSSATSGLPWYAILCLPVLFAAGMLFFDTLDGSFMTVAYGWALDRPVRKIYYNIVVTALSIAVAMFIGSLEIISLFHGSLDFHIGILNSLVGLDLSQLGFAIVAMFIATWLVSVVIWKVGRVEQKWTPAERRTATAPTESFASHSQE